MTHLTCMRWALVFVLLMSAAADATPVGMRLGATGSGGQVIGNRGSGGPTTHGIIVEAGRCGVIIRDNNITGTLTFDIQDLNPTCCNTYLNNTFSTSSSPAGCIQ